MESRQVLQAPPISRAELERILYPIIPRDLSLYWAALTHASVYNPTFVAEQEIVHPFYTHAGAHPVYGNNFEKLEFLGDSIIHASLAMILIRLFPDKDEGFLSRVRINVEQKSGLAQLCRHTGIANFVKKSPGMNVADDLLENVFEGFVGALFEDQQKFLHCGLQKCTDFLWRTLRLRFDDILHDLRVDNNFKDFVVRLKAKQILQNLTWTNSQTVVQATPTARRQITHHVELVCEYSPERVEYFRIRGYRDPNLLETIQSIPVGVRLERHRVKRSAKTIAEAEQAVCKELMSALSIEVGLLR
jgi:dsRNA-specific ribonuclease